MDARPREPRTRDVSLSASSWSSVKSCSSSDGQEPSLPDEALAWSNKDDDEDKPTCPEGMVESTVPSRREDEAEKKSQRETNGLSSGLGRERDGRRGQGKWQKTRADKQAPSLCYSGVLTATDVMSMSCEGLESASLAGSMSSCSWLCPSIFPLLVVHCPSCSPGPPLFSNPLGASETVSSVVGAAPCNALTPDPEPWVASHNQTY